MSQTNDIEYAKKISTLLIHGVEISPEELTTCMTKIEVILGKNGHPRDNIRAAAAFVLYSEKVTRPQSPMAYTGGCHQVPLDGTIFETGAQRVAVMHILNSTINLG